MEHHGEAVEPATRLGRAVTACAAILAALERSGVRADGVLTFWEDSAREAARVAAALGLPGNPPEAVDVARSKVRTRDLSARLGLDLLISRPEAR